MPHIIIKRKKEYFYFLRKFKIFLNDDFVGSIGVGETIRRIVPEGENSVQIRLEWCGSPIIKFQAQTDEIKVFEVESLESPRILNIVMVFLVALFFWFPPKFLTFPWFVSFSVAMGALLVLIWNLTLGRDDFLEINEQIVEPTIHISEK
jgi:hypothetical protein